MLNDLREACQRFFANQPERFVDISRQGDVFTVTIDDDHGKYSIELALDDTWPQNKREQALAYSLECRRDSNRELEFVGSLLQRFRRRLIDSKLARRLAANPADSFDEIDNGSFASTLLERLQRFGIRSPLLADYAADRSRPPHTSLLAELDQLVSNCQPLNRS